MFATKMFAANILVAKMFMAKLPRPNWNFADYGPR